MQTISGVHYNFSLPMAFWRRSAVISRALMPKRKYLRVISVLSVTTIASVGSFLICLVRLQRFVLLSCKENQRRCRLKTECGMYYLPYATSLRLSDLGYTNKSQSNLGITFNDLYSTWRALNRQSKRHRKSTRRLVLRKTVSDCKSTTTCCRLKTNCTRRFVQNALPAAASRLLMRCYVAALNILKSARWISTRSRRLV
ncbi:hypothetical protein DMI65_08825 [Escherichia coli]|nr:hypothetical protein [Escherichia coli]